MLLKNIDSLIEQYEDQQPSFYQRHKKKILAGALAAGAGTVAGYHGYLGSGIQKYLGDTALKASTNLSLRGAKLAGGGSSDFTRGVGRKLTNLGAKGMLSAGEKSLQARKIIANKELQNARDLVRGARDTVNSKEFQDKAKELAQRSKDILSNKFKDLTQ
jgi:hypothetical protein